MSVLYSMKNFFSAHRGWIACLVLFFALIFGEQRLLMEGLKRSRDFNLELWSEVTGGKINADVLILGSSRALVHYDCRVLTEKGLPGKSCYTAGMNGGSVQLHRTLLEVYLRNNKKPETVILDVDRIIFRGPLGPDGAGLYNPVQYLPFLHEPEVRNLFYQTVPSGWKYRWIPLYSTAVYGKELWTRALTPFFFPEKSLRKRGFIEDYQSWDSSFEEFKKMYPRGVECFLDPESVTVFQQMIEKLRARGIQVIVVHSPEYRELQKMALNHGELSRRIRSMALRRGAVYWDFTKITLNRNTKYFKNARHLNYYGAQIFSRLFARRLSRFLETSRASF